MTIKVTSLFTLFCVCVRERETEKQREITLELTCKAILCSFSCTFHSYTGSVGLHESPPVRWVWQGTDS